MFPAFQISGRGSTRGNTASVTGKLPLSVLWIIYKTKLLRNQLNFLVWDSRNLLWGKWAWDFRIFLDLDTVYYRGKMLLKKSTFDDLKIGEKQMSWPLSNYRLYKDIVCCNKDIIIRSIRCSINFVIMRLLLRWC